MRPVFLCLLLPAWAGCAKGPIAWAGPEYGASVPSRGGVVAGAREACPAAETSLGRLLYRIGWQATGELGVSFSADSGAAWSAAVPVDARTAETPACERPAPAAFADSVNRFLHVSYFLDAGGDAGVFYAHSMRSDRLAREGEGMFERPIAVVYGTNPARTAVASRGDTVVVAYEDPNSLRGSIHLALSVTAGHSFAQRGPVSMGPGNARHPTVSLGAGEVIVGWLEEGAAGTRPVHRRGRFR